MHRPELRAVWLSTAITFASLGLLGLSGCSSSGVKMAELQDFVPSAEVHRNWSDDIGSGENLFFAPALFGKSVYVAGKSGALMRLDAGKKVWRIDTGKALSAGVGSDGVAVVVATNEGEVIAYAADSGKLLWTSKVSSSVLAPPLVSDNLVFIRSLDNAIFAFDSSDGVRRWIYQRDAPLLEVRSAAPPIISGSYLMAGFPGGKLVGLNLRTGVLQWEGAVAQPRGATELDRIADVASQPVQDINIICAVAYQGRVACYDLSSGGKLLWNKDISSSAGLDISQNRVYVSDDKGTVHALDKDSGAQRWKQEALSYRVLSAPTAIGNFVVVGDVKGVIHVLKAATGELAARYSTDGTAISSSPRMLAGNLIVQTTGGNIYSLEIK